MVLPMIWWNWCVYYFAHREELDSNGCNPPLLPPAVVLGGLFFHGLNGWWGYKIVKRSLRTLSGKVRRRRRRCRRSLPALQATAIF